MVKTARNDYRLNGYCIQPKQGKRLSGVNTTAEVAKKGIIFNLRQEILCCDIDLCACVTHLRRY